MSENIGKNATGVASLKLAESPAPGWHKISLLRQPFFIKAVIIMLCFSSTSSLLQYLYRVNLIASKMKDMYTVFLYIFMFAGGMALLEKLNWRKLAVILLNIPFFQAWEYFYYPENPKMHVFFVLTITWPLALFVIREPETMAEFGLRKAHILKDLAAAVVIGALIAVYVGAIFHMNGFAFKQTDPWQIASHTSGMLGQNIFYMMFIFAVWNRMRLMGISQMENLLTPAVLVICMQAPFFIAFYAAHVISAANFALGLGGSVLLFTFIMGVTFRFMRHPLAANFAMIAINEILVSVGIL